MYKNNYKYNKYKHEYNKKLNIIFYKMWKIFIISKTAVFFFFCK